MKRSSLSTVWVLFLVAVLCAATAPAVEIRAKAPKVATPKFSPPTAARPAGQDLVAEWQGIPIVYLAKGPRLTAFAHDDHFLYVHFRFGDSTLARQVARTGVIVWFNGKGEHMATLGLRYHGSPEMLKVIGTGDKEAMRRPSDEDNAPSASPGALEILHGGEIVKTVDGGVEHDGAGATSSVAEGAFAYEFRVPLASLVPKGSAPPKRIAVGFQMHGLTPSELAAEGGRGGPPNRHSDESLGGSMGGSQAIGAATVKAFLQLGGILWVDVDLLNTPPPPAPQR